MCGKCSDGVVGGKWIQGGRERLSFDIVFPTNDDTFLFERGNPLVSFRVRAFPSVLVSILFCGRAQPGAKITWRLRIAGWLLIR
jgi:hypothetical protein